MFLMYVDESGDVGTKPDSSDWFALSAMVMHESIWNETLAAMQDFRTAAGEKYGFNASSELHASSMLGRSRKEKEYENNEAARRVSRYKSIRLLREALQFEASLSNVRLINVLVDKRSRKETEYDVFSAAWEALFNRFEHTINHMNFPLSNKRDEKGFLVVDQTDENKLRNLVRTMRHNNVLPDHFSGGTYTPNLTNIIEDPFHKNSKYSLPIQFCDINGYFLIQSVDPNAAVKKHGAKNYFYLLDPVLLKQVSRTNACGIVRL